MQPGEVVSRYRIVRHDGRAHQGSRFVAESARGQRVFLRVVPHVLGDEGVARVAQEVEVLRRIRHPGVLPVLDWGRLPRSVWICQAFMPGVRLAKHLDAGPIPADVAAAVALDVANTLAVLHEAGVIVRDLTPENILLAQSDGTARLVDLGLARVESPAMSRFRTAAGIRLGDPAYLPPEYIASLELGPATDLYGLGCSMFAMLTGAPPFRGTPNDVMLMQMGEDVPRPSGWGADVPKAMDDLVHNLLQKTPEERPSSANEVVEALERYLSAVLPTALGPDPAAW